MVFHFRLDRIVLGQVTYVLHHPQRQGLCRLSVALLHGRFVVLEPRSLWCLRNVFEYALGELCFSVAIL